MGVVHHCFYEVFDQLGPQLKWWIWDYELPGMGDVTLASVPLFSLVNFSLVLPIAFAALAHALLGRRRPQLVPAVGKSLLVGLLTPVCGAILSVNLLVTRLDVQRGALATFGWAIAVLAVLFAFTAFWRTRSRPLQIGDQTGLATSYLPIFGLVYLVTLSALWAASIGDYLGADGGLTAHGTPTGSLPYTLGCVFVCAWLISPYLTSHRERRFRERGREMKHSPAKAILGSEPTTEDL